MLTLLFIICLIGVFGRLCVWGVRAAWGISKFMVTVVLMPLILICMVIGGLLHLALPILIIVGLVVMFKSE